MARTRSTPIVDFGHEPSQSPYRFVLVADRAARGVRLEERFAGDAVDPGSDEAPALNPVVKATLDEYRWSRVAEAVRVEFNNRLSITGMKPARWRAGETVLAPYLGKELTLLLWVIEDADPSLIPNMVANWSGLAPEERWWLYTTINATAGHPEHGRDRGWRRAVKIALAENPSVAATPGGWLSRVDVDQPEPPKRTAAMPAKRKRHAPDQLALLPDEVAGQSSPAGQADKGTEP